MSRKRRIRRAQLLVGIVAGLIAGTIHALATHVAGRIDPSSAETQFHVERQ
jgi:stress-induced morphogen